MNRTLSGREPCDRLYLNDGQEGTIPCQRRYEMALSRSFRVGDRHFLADSLIDGTERGVCVI